MPNTCRRSTRATPTRRGSVLLVVLVVVMLLTYGVYGYTERMLAEAQAANSYGRAATARAMADSGVELAAAFVTARSADPENPPSFYQRPDVFAGVVMKPGTTPRGTGRFSLVAPVEADPSATMVRFGLIDESGKLNVNAIPNLGLQVNDQRLLLANLPLMTPDLADAILDYIDTDATARQYGAESYDATLTTAAGPKNGPLEALEELLDVPGVTPDLLYGEDANRNGLLDPSENDGLASPPIDDADGLLRPGWDSFLTVHSREANLKADGTAKIYLNQSLLTDLYDAVEKALNSDAAKFIVAYRMYGPTDPDTTTGTGTTAGGTGGSSGSSGATGATSGPASKSPSGQSSSSGSGQSSSSGASSATAGRSGSASSGALSPQSGLNALAQGLAQALTGGGGGTVTRGGLDLSGGAKFQITSLYDLIDREVNAQVDKQATTLKSPWTKSGILTDFPTLSALLSPVEVQIVEGRVNVNEARPEVLMGLPGMTPQIAQHIVAERGGSAGPAEESGDRRTTAWLVQRSLVDLPTMRKLDKYVTGQGGVFRVRSVGFFDAGGPVVRVEAVIDGTTTPAKIASSRELSQLGRGYSSAQLLPPGAAAASPGGS